MSVVQISYKTVLFSWFQNMKESCKFFLSHVYLMHPLGMALLEFHQYLWGQKTRVPMLPCRLKALLNPSQPTVMMCLAIFIEH